MSLELPPLQNLTSPPPLTTALATPPRSLAIAVERVVKLFQDDLSPLAPLLELTLLSSLSTKLGQQACLLIAYEQTLVRDLIIGLLTIVHPDVQTLRGADQLGAGAATTPGPVMVVDLPPDGSTIAAAREIAGINSTDAVLAVRHTAARSVVWLHPAETLTHGAHLTEVMIAREPQGNAVNKCFLEWRQMQFTAAGQLRSRQWQDACEALRDALRLAAPASVTLPPVDRRFGAKIPPQAASRATQILKLAAVIAALRCDTGIDTVHGCDADVDAAVKLAIASGANDDWPTVPEYVINLAKLFSDLHWGDGGNTFEQIFAELNRDHAEKATDRRYWPTHATPSGRWSRAAVRRRLWDLKKHECIRCVRDGKSLRWERANELEALVSCGSVFVQLLAGGGTESFSSFADAAENDQAAACGQ